VLGVDSVTDVSSDVVIGSVFGKWTGDGQGNGGVTDLTEETDGLAACYGSREWDSCHRHR
jgi:hypothetical protein